MKRAIVCCVVLVVVLLGLTASLSQTAWADDLNPPPWRGQPGTTFEEWVFSTPNPETPPDMVYNPYGVPIAEVSPGPGQDWMDLWGGHQGIWPLSGTIELDIPNLPEPNPLKDIWVQLTWAKQLENSTPDIWELDSGVHGSLVSEVVLGPTGHPAPNDLWFHSTYQIRLYPNPSSETVKIDGTLLVDQVVIDTRCTVPEPSSLSIALLALGGLALVRRRRK
ncbi:MAG: hypothetical protein A2W31_04320 [Planctomycetes bacterium RBG_16_64_10]|nr:MAG: hypothetical protein A2W31_04320 [Planctomycetes bacterium RBG_16_64_10]